MDPDEFEVCAAQVERAGYIRRRLRGGYKMAAVKGKAYLQDAILRNDDLRAEMSKQIDSGRPGR